MESTIFSIIRFTKRLLWVVLIVIILGALLYDNVYAHANYPRQVKVQVYGAQDTLPYRNNYVIIEWLQVSNAKKVCIHKNHLTDRGPLFILLDCFPSHMGINSFSTKGYVDYVYDHVDGETYAIAEYFENTFQVYDGYPAYYTYHMELINK